MKAIVFYLGLFLFSSSLFSQTDINELKEFEKISWQDLNYNAIKIISEDWMLVSAGSIDNGFNMMTASWGNLGWLWQKPVSIIYIKPQRYTYEFTEKEDYYVISFYKEEYKEVLRKMGTVSGRDFDKINYSELTPVKTENNSVAFKEAYLIIECKKVYSTIFKESEILDDVIKDRMYSNKDFHKMYIGEIVNIWKKKD